MKVLNVVYGVFCSISVLCICACDSEMSMLEVDDNKNMETFYLRPCEDEGDCLPKIYAEGNPYSVNIMWGGSSYGHEYFLTCKGADGQVYRSGLVGSNGGSWSFFLDGLDSYTVEYTIECTDIYDCKPFCKLTKSLKKNFWKYEAEDGSASNCHRKYYSYNIFEQYPSMDALLLQQNMIGGNESEAQYMEIDQVIVYKWLSYTEKQRQWGVSLEERYNGFLLTNLPMDPNGSYEVILTSNQCINAENEHYIFFKYTSDGRRVNASRFTTEELNIHQ